VYVGFAQTDAGNPWGPPASIGLGGAIDRGGREKTTSDFRAIQEGYISVHSVAISILDSSAQSRFCGDVVRTFPRAFEPSAAEIARVNRMLLKWSVHFPIGSGRIFVSAVPNTGGHEETGRGVLSIAVENSEDPLMPCSCSSSTSRRRGPRENSLL